MRIIGDIPHPHLKITVFKMSERVSVKFENEGYEQTYKLGQDERVSTLEGVQQVIDAAFIQQVLQLMQQMHQSRIAAFGRAFHPPGEEAFEDII